MPRARNAIRRRLPKQERSRRLVEAIVEAARRVLAESGPDGLTTVNVAQRAGVSVGSLYQYFAGRDALLFAIYEDELTRFRAGWRAWERESVSVPTPERIEQGLELALAHYRKLAVLDPAFFLQHREEILRGLRPRRARTPARADTRTRDGILRARGILRAGRCERPEAAAFILEHGIPGLLDAALAHQPEILATAEFAEELRELVCGYLLRDREA